MFEPPAKRLAPTRWRTERDRRGVGGEVVEGATGRTRTGAVDGESDGCWAGWPQVRRVPSASRSTPLTELYSRSSDACGTTRSAPHGARGDLFYGLRGGAGILIPEEIGIQWLG